VLPFAASGGDVAVHDVLADEATGYARQESVLGGSFEVAGDLGLRLVRRGAAVVVDRVPGWAAYPRDSGPARLFALEPGEIGRYRANFRFRHTTCPCNPSWYFEDWLILVGHGRMAADGFVSCTPTYAVDHRVHLYGGSRRAGRA